VVAAKVAFDLERTSFRGIGLMCGTSRDGIDIADVSFSYVDRWEFCLHAAEAVSLSDELLASLKSSMDLNARDYLLLDHQVGEYFGLAVKGFINRNKSEATYVASHGITTFHQPEVGLTHQLGSGAKMSTIIPLPVVTEFRSQDVALGGEGAPLVPYCDAQLFSTYEATLNLGGFANISLLKAKKTGVLGFDICPANRLLDTLVNRIGLQYDNKGELAKSGKIIPELLTKMDALPYYLEEGPKSLGEEWFEKNMLSLIIPNHYPVEDLLHTSVIHISTQVAKHLDFKGKCLVTGGGALNDYLIQQIQLKSQTEIIIPSNELIQFKEAICFAFLGGLRMIGVINTNKWVTGARTEVSAGAVYLPPSRGVRE
jgi:anhydro-N-acetylmuramic acid kinase